MNFDLVKRTKRHTHRIAIVCTALLLALFLNSFFSTTQAQPHLTDNETVTFYTMEWAGERDEYGRPYVADSILERMRHVSVEEAWSTLRGYGYTSQLEAGWEVVHSGDVMTGRALTTAFLPRRPELDDRMTAIGREEGLMGGTNQWPIGLLTPGDVIVADHYGKIREAAFIGDNLAQAVFSNSGNGAVMYGQARDITGVRQIQGFNAWAKAWHPSSSAERMLISINDIVRIGEAVVLPGDVVLATDSGVMFVPPHLAEAVILNSEITRLTDGFRIEMISEGQYSSQQIYSQEWTGSIRSHFFQWLSDERDRLTNQYNVADEVIGRMVRYQSLDWESWPESQ